MSIVDQNAATFYTLGYEVLAKAKGFQLTEYYLERNGVKFIYPLPDGSPVTAVAVDVIYRHARKKTFDIAIA